jgi:hypothetical protein
MEVRCAAGRLSQDLTAIVAVDLRGGPFEKELVVLTGGTGHSNEVGSHAYS